MRNTTPFFKALANLAVVTWDNFDEAQLADGFDPMEQLAKLVEGYDVDKPNCIAQLMYFYGDSPLDLTLCQIVELCREYVKV